MTNERVGRGDSRPVGGAAAIGVTASDAATGCDAAAVNRDTKALLELVLLVD